MAIPEFVQTQISSKLTEIVTDPDTWVDAIVAIMQIVEGHPELDRKEIVKDEFCKFIFERFDIRDHDEQERIRSIAGGVIDVVCSAAKGAYSINQRLSLTKKICSLCGNICCSCCRRPKDV